MAEVMMRNERGRRFQTPVCKSSVAVYPGNVIAVYMSKPQGLKYTSGQHPFSITFAPGDDHLSIRIRTVGDWTSQLRAVFSEVLLAIWITEVLLAICLILQALGLPRLLIDGPYGAPEQDYKKYDVVLLVGLGIGATPLIHIVLNNAAGAAKRKQPFSKKRTYFYWVMREQGSFEWFRGVMNEMAEMDHGGAIDVHNYCTSVYEEGDARSALLVMLQALYHAKNGVDIVSGTWGKTHFARPNWRSVFNHVAANHSDERVGVFYCGPLSLVGELRRLAKDVSWETTTSFEFHKENF
ncbi:unnamed protein product [Spirodela intermedia]|uniref:Uncharacterized protein n=1 Tax=Spirodela intermedia TaxID=51605 RepID=A0A7I8KSK1_SPIIN|nr:unnamed protein product [Spirodela intermedia]